MKYFIIFLTVIIFFSCSAKKVVKENRDKITEKKVHTITVDDIVLDDSKVTYFYANLITSENVKVHVEELASDKYEGRLTGEKGQKMAANYIRDFYKKIGVEPGIKGTDKYFQTIPKDFLKGKSNFDTQNVLGFIYGSEKPEEIIVISGHYDHLGHKNDEIYNGADDNASGTAAVLEIAKIFQQAVIEGEGPKRSILFLNLTGEEEGLFGSKYYTSHPIYNLKNTIADLNIDMVGRVDPKHEEKKDYIYLIGADKISQELHFISEAVNNKYTKLDLDYTYNDEKDPNRFYYRSDHYNFAKNGIPIIFYFNGVHADYHQPTDTADKIDYEQLAKRARLVFLTAWELANREERLKID